jgi:nicotinamidase-related amidase
VTINTMIATKDGTALLVIDVQLGMFKSPIIPPAHDGESLLQRVSSLISRARSQQVPIFFVQHCGGKGHPLEEGTREFEIHQNIAPKPGEPVIRKHFCDSFHETALQPQLRSREIRSLIIMGIATEFCVDTATRRAFSLGYDVSLVKDAHSTWDAKELKARQIIDHHNPVPGQLFARLVAADSVFDNAVSIRASMS